MIYSSSQCQLIGFLLAIVTHEIRCVMKKPYFTEQFNFYKVFLIIYFASRLDFRVKLATHNRIKIVV